VTSLVVIDAPSVVELLLNGDEALDVLEAIHGRSVAAPAHVDVDVLSALARIQEAGISGDIIRERIEIYLRMPLERYDVCDLMIDALDATGSDALSTWGAGGKRVSDVLCVVLAQRLGVPLVTRDPDLAAACSRSILVQPGVLWGAPAERE
jgi:predicted nucleic acid-binding protein